MKKKNIMQKTLAIILSFVILATSVPAIVSSAAGGIYDPAPKFSDEAQAEGANAWLDDDGNVQVTFPSAEAEPTYSSTSLGVESEQLAIDFYIVELVDLGPVNTAHTETVISTIKVSANKTRAKDNSATFVYGTDFTQPIDLEENRYSVSITAVDTENWFSQPIYTIVNDVPEAYVDSDKIINLSTSDTAAREIMTFDDGTDDGHTSGNALLYMGVTSESGTQNTDGTSDTTSLRFIMYDSPSGTQTFDTSYSRQTWDFNGAEEMWVWMDLEGVSLTGLAFRLKTNEKAWQEWNDDASTLTNSQREGSIVYSTKGTAAAGYTGEAPYVYVQQEDGTWEQVMLKADGTLDIGNFVGYIRVPLQFMCSETDTYVDISNQEIACGYDYKSGVNNTVQDSDVQSWLQSMTFGKITVDPAGTPISEALLIHRRSYLSSSGFLNAGNRHLYMWNADGITHLTQSYTSGNPSEDFTKIGYMLAIPLGTSGTDSANDVKTGEVSTDRAYIANGTVQNREGGLKAIDDIYTAGFSIEGCSADSLKEDFYLDNIFFYRTDGGAYSENTLDGNPNTGNPIADYYDEELEISQIIFDEIDKYITYPDWADYLEVHYIQNLIAAYKEAYLAVGKADVSFLDDENLAATAEALGRTSWDKYLTAYNACAKENTLDTANATKYDLVPLIVDTLEKMPKAREIESVSETLRTSINKIWKAYTMLNLGQLQMLGDSEEKEIIQLVSLLDNFHEGTGDEFVVGQALADYPYIVFNDFENQEVGTKGYQLENDNNAYTSAVTGGTGDLANDWRHLKGLVTYSTNGNTNLSDRDYYGYGTTDDDKTQEAMDSKVLYDASYAKITDNGYLNSKAATVYIENTGTAENQSGVYHSVTFSREGQDVSSFSEMEANNTGLDGLGEFASTNTTSTPGFLVSLIFYVDFTELTDDFYFITRVYTKDEDGNPTVAATNMGVDLLGAAEDDWHYFILDPDTGEWKQFHTTSQYCFNSSGNSTYDSDLGFTLKNYQGYIKVPLYHLKYKESLVSEPKLDENETMLNSIYAIQFAVGGASSLYGKSYTIDNVGFTYDAAGYENATTVNKTYAEQFDAKSVPAKTFEEYVSGDTIYETEIQSLPQVDENGDPLLDDDGNQVYADVTVQIPYPGIDIYDEETRAERIEKAMAMYEALPLYQQGVVIDAYNKLLEYINAIKEPISVPEPSVTVEEFNAFVDSLSWEATEAVVDGDYDLPYPGFYRDDNGEAQVNYGTYGLTDETAKTIIEYYNNAYAYYSVGEKAQITNLTGFMNAYKAAMRTSQTLENIKTEGEAFSFDDMTTSSTAIDGTEVSGLLSIENHSNVVDFWENEYYTMGYYSKILIDSGDINNLQNISRGTNYYMKNTGTYTIDGEVIEGGVINYQNKMQAIYDDALAKITAKELFTDEEITEIKYILEQYDNFLPAYNSVKELFDLKQQILGLFPVIDTVAPDTTEILLTDEKLTGDTSTYKVEYSEILDYDNTDDKYFIRVTSEKGALENENGDSVPYAITLNGTAKGSDELVEATAFTEDVTNNVYTPDAPLSYTITPSLSEKPSKLSGMIFDTVTVELVLIENIMNEDGTVSSGTEVVVESHAIDISYSAGDTYTVVIPAEIPVEWNDSEAVDVSYSVTTEMLTTSKLKVGVTSDGTNKLTSVISADTLDYTTENFKQEEFGYNVAEAKPVDTPTVTVSGWALAPVGEYRTTLTYTVEYLTDQEPDDGTT